MLVHSEVDLLSRIARLAPQVPRGWIILGCALAACLAFGGAFWIITVLLI